MLAHEPHDAVLNELVTRDREADDAVILGLEDSAPLLADHDDEHLNEIEEAQAEAELKLEEQRFVRAPVLPQPQPQPQPQQQPEANPVADQAQPEVARLLLELARQQEQRILETVEPKSLVELLKVKLPGGE